VSRRTAERHARRIEVRFWRRGNPQPHSGFTVDVSRSGLFLGTAVPLDPGERLRLELVDRERGFIVEAEVARVHRVALVLRHVEQPGIGVRFLAPAELVSDLIAGSKTRTSQTPAHFRMPGAAPPRPAASTPQAGAEPRKPPPVPLANQRELDDLFGEGPPPAAGASAPALPTPAVTGSAPEAIGSSRSVAVEFVDRASFLSVYHRDIAAGGLFVTSDVPAALQEIVVIELRPPIRTPHPLRFEARVVHRFDPASGTGGKGGLAGMGVQFLDPDRVRAALAPVLTELRR